MILALKTADPTCQMFLLDKDGNVITRQNWLAERRLAKELLSQLEKFLGECALTFSELSGLIVFKGPGSFTGLRIGLSVMNTLSYSLQLPITGATGEDWLPRAYERLKQDQTDHIIMPEYGSLPHITVPKK